MHRFLQQKAGHQPQFCQAIQAMVRQMVRKTEFSKTMQENFRPETLTQPRQNLLMM